MSRDTITFDEETGEMIVWDDCDGWGPVVLRLVICQTPLASLRDTHDEWRDLNAATKTC